MSKVDDNERREIARKLRKCTPPTSYGQSQGGGWAHLCDMALAVGFKREDNPTAWEFAQRLADLIEPSDTTKCVANVTIDGEQLHECVNQAMKDVSGIDRDALVAIVAEMDEYEMLREDIEGRDVGNFARRLRGALGMTSYD